MERRYDRGAEDLGNIVALEHVNLQVEDQGLATTFYVNGLGLTRDPYMMTGIDFMWVNVGRNQFHLITGTPQRVRGRIGLVVPDRGALLRRLQAVRQALAGTRFDFIEHDDHIEATCPWGNRIRCHAPAPRFGPVTLGMAYIELDVPPGAAAGTAAFYGRILGAIARVDESGPTPLARVTVGIGQELLFRETDAPLPPFDGHHIQIYVVNFSGPHRLLLERGLVTEESNQHQYRFDTITDPDSGKPLVQIEHEVRSLRHPLYARPLVNRNAGQSPMNYAPGYDAWIPGTMPQEMEDPRFAILRQRAEQDAQRSATVRGAAT
jgi:hypothetical protein